MRICIFEDIGVGQLKPLTLCRPAFDLLCGASSLLSHQRGHFGAQDVGVWVRPELADLCRLVHPELAVNDPNWLRGEPTILVNARWLPGQAALVGRTDPHLGFVGDQIAYAVVPTESVGDCSADTLEEHLHSLSQTLP